MDKAKTNSLFRTIWRLNGIVIFGAITIGTLIFIGILINLLIDNVRDEPSKPAPNVAPVAEGKPKLQLGGFERVLDSSIVKAGLGESGSSYSLKGGPSGEHNLLFVETKTGQSWWLLPDSNSVITSKYEVGLEQDKQKQLLAMLYEITTAQKPAAVSTLLLADPQGVKKLVLASGDLELDQVITLSSTEAKVLFHRSNGYFVITINPTEMTKTQETAIAFTYPPQK